ncbi:unnamed protein product [Ilex paraguariensis]|uniref:MBD domain-containing protein n=1 Tax=Ilex paraguariensis TaxID=185542 RepID=A0ABC8QW76_9AQUA
MDKGSPSHGRPKLEIQSQNLSPLTSKTLEYMQMQPRRKPHNPGTKSCFFDTSCPGYGWLLPGWVAEERTVQSGRLYRYYYDPDGHQYNKLHEVLAAWERKGIVLVDY